MTKAPHPFAAIAAQIRADLDALLAACDDDGGRPAIATAAHRLAMTRPDGLKGTSYDGVGGHGTQDGSPPPPGVDLNRTVIGDYPGKADLHALARHLDAAATITARWLPHSAPSVAQRLSVSRVNEPVCASCDRYGFHEHVHRIGDVAGNLPEPMSLGAWCYRFTRDNGRLPSEAEVTRHHKGLVVRVKA